MVTEITRKMLHSIIDDSIENDADTLLITSYETMRIIVGEYDVVEGEWIKINAAADFILVGELDNENKRIN